MPTPNISLDTIYECFVQDQPMNSKMLSVLLREGGDALDLLDLLPAAVLLNGKPMDVKNRRPMFARLFRKDRKTKREIYLCGRQVSKTTNAGARIFMNSVFRNYFRSMYIAPLQTYTLRLNQIHLNPFIRNFRMGYPIQDKHSANNVNSKTFLTGSSYNAAACFSSPAQIIGLAADDLTFDEVQDLNIDFVPMARETLRTSDYRWETYFGTARGIENTIQVLFDESSGGEWLSKCGCGLWIEPTREKHAVSMIQPQGIACPKCSRPYNFKNGEWVHKHPDRVKDFGGYHIPATIVRDVCFPQDRYLDTIYNKLHGISRYSESKFFQEVLGISSDQGGRPITPDELKRASILQIGKDYPQVNMAEYMNVSGGADWGGSEVTSFTVGAIVGIHHTGKWHCLGAIRPMGIPDNDRHIPLATFFRRVGQGSVNWIGADAGFVGSVQNKNLSKESGITTASIAYGTQKHFYKGVQGNNFVVDRTTLIYIVYSMIREGHLFFPEGSDFQQYTNDLTATFIEDIESPTGATSRRYCRYKQRADDFLHALGYAIFVCAVTSGIDLTQMFGLGAMTSFGQNFIDADEGTSVY